MRHLYLICLALLLSSAALAQQATVSGQVTDGTSQDPIPGASIQIKGTTAGVVTDANGNFRLETTTDATLVVSFIGYKTTEVAVNGRTQLTISLATDVMALEEVVVSAFGIERDKDKLG